MLITERYSFNTHFTHDTNDDDVTTDVLMATAEETKTLLNRKRKRQWQSTLQRPEIQYNFCVGSLLNYVFIDNPFHTKLLTIVNYIEWQQTKLKVAKKSD